MGADIRFESQLTDLDIRDGALHGITVTGPEGTYTLPCRQLILCPGHSARDTFELLYRRGVPMEAKPFAVGVRIEQRQSDCDAAQYKQYAGHPGLPASTYKLSCHLPNGRGVFSFCVCPGGQVVAAASEEHRVVTNGMSEFARDKENINGALLVNVTPEDFGGDGPLAGMPSSGIWKPPLIRQDKGITLPPPSGWRTSLPSVPPQGRAGSFPVTAPALHGRTSGTACRTSWRRPSPRRCLSWAGS